MSGLTRRNEPGMWLLVVVAILAAAGCATDNLSRVLSQDRNACASVNGQYLMANVKFQACRANDIGTISVTPDGTITMDVREHRPVVCPSCPQRPNIREPAGLGR